MQEADEEEERKKAEFKKRRDDHYKGEFNAAKLLGRKFEDEDEDP